MTSSPSPFSSSPTLQQHIDTLLDLSSYTQLKHYLTQLHINNNPIYLKLSEQLKHTLTVQSQSKLTYNKLLILQIICSMDKQLDVLSFKTSTIYQLISVIRGYMNNDNLYVNGSVGNIGIGSDIRGIFARNLKKNPTFWGTSSIQSIYTSLVNKSTPTILPIIDLNSRFYLWKFIKQNQQLFPNNFDYYQYAIKHILMLRIDRKQQLQLINIIIDIFIKYQYSYQSLSRNYRFILQFFRSNYNQKQLGLGLGNSYIYPHPSVLHLIKNYNNYQIDRCFNIGSLGLNWSSIQVLNCINNVLKLGITQNSYRLLKGFIELFKQLKKYHQLIQAYQKNIQKIFVFLKFPQLYVASLKTLKQFILGPWAVTGLYNVFIGKVMEFVKLKNVKQNRQQYGDFILLLACVVEKYRESTLVNDLENIIDHQQSKGNQGSNGSNGNRGDITPQKIRAQILEYDWRIFENTKKNDKQTQDKDKDKDDKSQNRGIINIGNSCYMNSFLQCLFMTKQYRRNILEQSTLNIEKQVLTKLQQRFNNAKQGKNLAMMARQTVRPLAQLQRTFSLLLKSKRPAINPTNIKNISPIEFQNLHQHDCIQFGRFLIEIISRSIDNIFEGQSMMEIECPYCGVKRQKTQVFLDLMLGSSNQDVQTIQSLLKTSLQDEHIDGLVCERCNNDTTMRDQSEQQEIKQKIQEQVMKKQENQPSTENNKNNKQKQGKKQIKPSIKRHWISKCPNFIILTLKRFEYNMKQNKNIKKQFKLEFQQNFIIGQTEYLIYAFIVHRGSSANSGHYFTFSRQSYDPDLKPWLCLNDSTVTKLQDFSRVIQFLSSNQQDTPYIIFGIQKKYWLQNWKKLQQPLTLRPPLQNFVEKDDMQYIKSMSKKGGTIDLSMLKFATGNFMRKDDQDDPYSGMGSGFGNNPIM